MEACHERRAKADGFVSRSERYRLNRERDQASRDIDRLKHNYRVAWRKQWYMRRLAAVEIACRIGQLPLPLGQRAHLLPRRCAWASCSPARRPFLHCSSTVVPLAWGEPERLVRRAAA